MAEITYFVMVSFKDADGDLVPEPGDTMIGSGRLGWRVAHA